MLHVIARTRSAALFRLQAFSKFYFSTKKSILDFHQLHISELLYQLLLSSSFEPWYRHPDYDSNDNYRDDENSTPDHFPTGSSIAYLVTRSVTDYSLLDAIRSFGRVVEL